MKENPLLVYELLFGFAALGSLTTIAIYGKRIGYRNLRDKHFLVIFSVFFIPFYILPCIFQTPLSPFGKTMCVVGLAVFGYARYTVTTSAQKNIVLMLEARKKKGKKIS